MPGDEDDDSTCSVHEGMQRLVQLLPRVMRGLRRPAPAAEPEAPGTAAAEVPLGIRHRSALALVRDGGTTVGSLAAALDLTLPTVSGLVADLERVGFVQRSADPADRRRTLLSVCPDRQACADQWLEGASAPLVRALGQLSPHERATFVKAMRFLDAELARADD